MYLPFVLKHPINRNQGVQDDQTSNLIRLARSIIAYDFTNELSLVDYALRILLEKWETPCTIGTH